MNTLWWQSSLKRGSSGVMWLKFLWNWNGFKTINQREDIQPGGFFTNLLRNGVYKMLPMPGCCYNWVIYSVIYICVENSTTKIRVKAVCTVNEIPTSHMNSASHNKKNPRLIILEATHHRTYWIFLSLSATDCYKMVAASPPETLKLHLEPTKNWTNWPINYTPFFYQKFLSNFCW